MLDGDAASGYRVVVDIDQDGDLANDPIWPLQRTAADWRTEIAARPRVPGGPPQRFVLAFDGSKVRVYIRSIRTGTIAVDGHPLKFAITCRLGDCSDADRVCVGFDLDGDGAVDLMSDGSIERYLLRDRTVVAFGKSFEFAIADNGGRLALRPAKLARAPRPTLARGSAAPPFDAADRGARFSLTEHRGRVVLIDFFAEGCNSCVAELPWLSSVHQRYAPAGLDVVTIGADAAPPGAHDWPTVVETEPYPVGALYRVSGFPTYFVVDRDGTIACARCERDEVDRALAPLFTASR